MKQCSICGKTKPYSEFHKQASSSDGFGCWCKPCKSVKKRQQYLANRDAVLARVARYRKSNPEKVALAKAAARLKRIDAYKEKSRQRYRSNRDAAIKRQAEYRRRNWTAVLARNTKYKRDRLRSDPLFRLEYAVRNRTFVAFRDKGYGKKSRTRDLIGCDWSELMAHMQSLFSPGMTMENYGQWHVDHIVPLSSAKTEDELIALCHYTNLQPLWAEDNIRKGASLPEVA